MPLSALKRLGAIFYIGLRLMIPTEFSVRKWLCESAEANSHSQILGGAKFYWNDQLSNSRSPLNTK